MSAPRGSKKKTSPARRLPAGLVRVRVTGGGLNVDAIATRQMAAEVEAMLSEPDRDDPQRAAWMRALGEEEDS